MARKTIALSGDEDDSFRRLYVSWEIPRGQYRKHPEYLERFADAWRGRTGRSDTADDCLHYMDTMQKITKRLAAPWPKFNGAYKKLDPVDSALSLAHTKVLCAIYKECILPLGLGSDSLCYRDDLLRLIAREFTKRTGLRIVGMLLASILESLRKSGDLPRLGDVGFEDIDDVG